MLAVGLPLEAAQKIVAETEGRVSSSLRSTVQPNHAGGAIQMRLNGSRAELTSQNLFNRLLEVEVAYHSPTMDPSRNLFARPCSMWILDSPKFRLLYSTVTGERVTGIAYGADYWPEKHSATSGCLYRPSNICLPTATPNSSRWGPHPFLATSLKSASTFR